MDVGIVILLTIFIGLMMLIVQRVERKRRAFVVLILLVIGELLRRYVWYRGYHGEAWIALIAAAAINLTFWLLVGRYNPVISSDRIHVLGMDD
jgi:hypothetical protein